MSKEPINLGLLSLFTVVVTGCLISIISALLGRTNTSWMILAGATIVAIFAAILEN